MRRTRQKRDALMSCGIALFLLLIPVGLTAITVYRQRRQERLHRALITAVKRNDDRAVVTLLRDGADANCRDEPARKFSLWGTLMQAFRGKKSLPRHASTSLLIALKLREKAMPPAGHPATVTAYKGVITGSTIRMFDNPPENLPLLRALLDHGAQINQMDADGNTPLTWAIDSGMIASVHLLLARGAIVNARHVTDVPLVLALQVLTDTDVITDLVERGADVNQRSADGETPLLVAARCERVDAVRLLLAHRANVTVRDINGMTPLGWALQNATSESRPIIRLLKAAGAKQ